MRARLGPLLGLWVGLAACDDRSYRDIGGEITILTSRTDGLVAPATERLGRFGRSALPQIEIALHTAKDSGRRNLIAAIARIGDGEAIPILRHFAVYDVNADVRADCEALLRLWASGPADKASAATAALTRVAELRAHGEGPAPARP